MIVKNNTDLIKILIVDDHSLIREGLRMIIENEPEIKIAGEASNGADALEIAAREQPDVVLLDIDLNGESGIDLIEKILERSKDTKILMLTGVLDGAVHQRAMQLGALGILIKTEVSRVLLKAIRSLNNGEVWLNRTMTAKVLSSHRQEREKLNGESKILETLTARERDIIRLIAEGCTNKEISNRLFIGEKTVRNYLTIIYDKLSVSSRLELAIYAANHNLDK
jgi:DNA-binding NarL/FixJ family response regulator